MSVCVCMWVLVLFASVQLFVTSWAAAHQAPLSMEFSRQEYQSGSPFSTLGDLPDPRGQNPHLLCLLPWQADSLPTVPHGKPCVCVCVSVCVCVTELPENRIMLYVNYTLKKKFRGQITHQIIDTNKEMMNCKILQRKKVLEDKRQINQESFKNYQGRTHCLQRHDKQINR